MLRKRLINRCPICGGTIEITEIRCRGCGTIVRGRFKVCEFCALSEEHLEFLRLFLKVRGNLSLLAKKMGISHPTVRHRLKELLRALGYKVEEDDEEEEEDVIDLLEKGEVSVDEAIELLKRGKEDG